METSMPQHDHNQFCSRGSFVGSSDARFMQSANEPTLLQLRCEARGEVEPGGLSGKPSPNQPYDCGNTKPCPVRAAHAEFVAGLAGHPPQTIPLDTDAIDLEDRAGHLDWVFSALSVYVAVILDDTAQNVPGGLDLRDAEALLADLASDLTGAIQNAAEDVAGRVE
jgi:hypothetical protein